MENNIGIGLIVGITTASGIYVWNSKDFTKEQKTLLLVCIIFPPLHWLLILLVLGYNKYKSKNTPQRLSEKRLDENKTKLNSSIDNLADLRGKGILTETEYKEIVKKIEAQKTEQELINSTEYKQLKSLLDANILSKNEFEDKLKILLEKNSIIAKESFTNFEQQSSQINLNDLVEDENISNKNIERKSNSLIYIVVAVILIIIANLINWDEVLGEIESYKNNSNKEVINEPAIDSPAVVIDNYENSNIVTNYQKKFVYIVITTKEPKLIHHDGIFLPSSEVDGFSTRTEDIDYVDYETSTYSTEIKEISDYNEDTKNILLDKTEYDVKQRMNMSSNFQTDLFIKCKDENKRSTLKDNYSKIIDRQIYAFDTYTDASLDKQANKNLNN
ncbi:SHOCT domain-containing protein [Flavobacterium gawalongense]|uniref:SHOCT domain-containing protein n=1 Tax=Flavobacterium gawalongense TaxID=2594432 RepID=A0A553BBB4_9FLAO|nr:SHOCT domain-containing protein [Flavobacterium gawalongense]TRW97177.1 hypothetical protein FNW33_16585 [Flavobacterium gawalongense]TRX02132.1 hypothetical protein FNW12_16490 [Flavobacterium gawalongense]TRX05542.1 hypothetical protein FNW11_16030 [Flavobacterium gawalongense]TRX06375.1 hypothetical protein FNW10_16130 [Flavobacterium gawalongense]TRX21982.1 hypothetical protein FNW38_16125 [Flavobacterium gawalongense]